MRLSAGGWSETGPRPANEDVYFIDLDLGLLLVADGMGGHRAGEVASRLACDAVTSFIRDTAAGSDMTWPYPFDRAHSFAVNRLSVALRVANREVLDAGRRNPRYAGMGTTIVAGLIEGDRIVIAHAGDSRAYRARGMRLQQMTQDDTWLNVMMASGAGAAAAAHPMRHALTRGVGMKSELSPTITEVSLVRHEHWLLTSDGVHGVVAPDDLKRLLNADGPDLAARQVVRAAIEAPTSDNATAVVLFVQA
jgi:serine/threonine protein phosphatase PrpC